MPIFWDSNGTRDRDNIIRPVELAVPHLPSPLSIARPQGKAMCGRDFEGGTCTSAFPLQNKILNFSSENSVNIQNGRAGRSWASIRM
jgi:hypothetical protein